MQRREGQNGRSLCRTRRSRQYTNDMLRGKELGSVTQRSRYAEDQWMAGSQRVSSCKDLAVTKADTRTTDSTQTLCHYAATGACANSAQKEDARHTEGSSRKSWNMKSSSPTTQQQHLTLFAPTMTKTQHHDRAQFKARPISRTRMQGLWHRFSFLTSGPHRQWGADH